MKEINDKMEKYKIECDSIIKKNSEYLKSVKNLLNKMEQEIVDESLLKTQNLMLEDLNFKCDEILNNNFINIDENNDAILNEKNDLLLEYIKDYKSSNEALIKYYYNRGKTLNSNNLNNTITTKYEEYLLNIENVDNKIINTKKLIKLASNKLQNFNKNIKKTKNIIAEKTINNYDKKILTKNIRLINKIREKTKLLEFETEDKELTKEYIKQIKKTISDSFGKIKMVTELDNKLTDLKNNNNNKELNTLLNETSKDDSIKLLNELIEIVYKTFKEYKTKNIENITIKKVLFSDYNDEEKNNHKKIVDEIKKLNTMLNLQILEKRKLDLGFRELFKIKNEYIHVDNMDKNQLKVLNKLNWIVIDPGMNSLFTMLSKPDEKGKQKKYSYTKQKHLSRTKRNEIARKMNKIRNEKIIKIENSLTKENERLRTSNSYEKFNLYNNEKSKIYEEVKELYNDKRINKLKWYSYINEKRSENMMINDIKKKFGENLVLILGDWSMKKGIIKGHSATPNMKYTKILEREFITLKIDEFRTSIMHNKLEKKCINLKTNYKMEKSNIKSVFDMEKIKEIEKKNEKKEKMRVIHKILVCNSNVKLDEKSNKGNYPKKTILVNRDNNSVKNMVKIVKSYIETDYKPECFVRGTKICKDTLKIFEKNRKV